MKALIMLMLMTSIAWAELDYEVGDIYYSNGKKYQVISMTPDKMQMTIGPYKEPPRPPKRNYEQEYYRRLLIEKGWE